MYGQDTLYLSLADADRIFLEKNLMVAAAKWNVSAQKALEIQARLYPNPEFAVGINAYDADNRKAFVAGRQGEKTVDFQQLILLGGKRKNQIRLAEAQTYHATIELEELFRELKFVLHKNFYAMHFDLRSLEKYDLQLNQLDTIINAYETQVAKGNIPLMEVVRLKSTYIRINNDKTTLLGSIYEQQKNLQTLLHTDLFVFPDMEKTPPPRFLQLVPVDSLIHTARQYRSDLRLAQAKQDIAAFNTRYQKSLAVPDLTLGTAYDQMGGAFRHQFLLTAAIPLPFWNRNQGNIKSAEALQQMSGVHHQLQEEITRAEVQEAWIGMQRAIREYEKTADIYNADFPGVFDGMQANFLKRNISIVEFIDFFESYNETVAQVYEIRKKLMLSAEHINYTTGYPVY